MHPTDAIFHWARHCPQRLAILLPDMAITYKALAEAIEAVSERIVRYDFDPYEPVAVAIGDPAKFLAVCHSLLRNGISCAPASANIYAQLQSNKINTLIFSGESEASLGGRGIRFEDSWLQGNKSTSPQSTKKNASRYGDLIFFTSGTTGIPKKVIVPDDAFTARMNMLTVTGEAAHNRVLILPGLGSVFGFNRTASVLYAGKTACFAYGVEAQLRFVNTFNIDVVIGSTQQISDIVSFVEKSDLKYNLGSLKELWISGGFAPDELVRRAQSCVCRNVGIVYGSSESGFVASAPYDLISHIPQAVGYVTPDMKIEIVDVANASLPSGREGLVRGQSSFIAKIFAANHPEKAAEAADAWWYPGDLGRLTDDGILCVIGRIDDVINMGGVKVAAELLDEEARRYPGVKDAGVCGVTGPSGIEELWIGVVAGAEIDIEAMKIKIEESQIERIPIGNVLLVDKIPRNDIGKLQRHELKALLLSMKHRALSGA
jgi:acyl-coenzyme A synthetase/AMP-(fatty) acid ligase